MINNIIGPTKGRLNRVTVNKSKKLPKVSLPSLGPRNQMFCLNFSGSPICGKYLKDVIYSHQYLTPERGRTVDTFSQIT